MSTTAYNRVSTLIVGAGPAGLAAAITLKNMKPETDICVIDKADGPGHHNLSGAAVEPEALEEFFTAAIPNWRENEQLIAALGNRIDKDLVYNFINKDKKIDMMPAIKLAHKLKLGLGGMLHENDYMLSISKLTAVLCKIAADAGIEVMHGFAVKDILYKDGKAEGVVLGEQGLDREGEQQPNYLPAEEIYADTIILAEGCDGLLTETFVEKARLQRKAQQLYSVGVKEVIRVSDEQYASFGQGTCLHAMGYPVFTLPSGPQIFGGGVMYAMEKNHIAVGMITGLDWKERNFNPQDALTHFKNIPFVNQYISGGTVSEAGAKMIPEGGWNAVPRDPGSNAIGKGNVLLVGDSAGLVNMHKIKGIHNAIRSGMLAGQAIADNLQDLSSVASDYTARIEKSKVAEEMKQARNYRQTIAKFGMVLGMPLSVISTVLPEWKIEPDYETLDAKKEYAFKHNKEFDKDTFTALALTHHREEEPCHLLVQNRINCLECEEKYGAPCITFCPAGVYESIGGHAKPANPSNCLHCKTCQRKCPYDNIRWTVPEGGGGPRYGMM